MVGFSMLIVLLMSAFYFWHNAGYAVDDSYITFRYAQNAMDGNGLVFNVGQKYYGSTATGYAIMLALLGDLSQLLHLGLDIPTISTFLSALFTASLAIVSFLIVWKSTPSRSPGKMLIALVMACSMLLVPGASLVSAHETNTYVGMLAIASYLAISSRRYIAASIVLAIATTVRPDSILFALILYTVLGVSTLVSARASLAALKPILLSALVYCAGFALWIVFTKLYYGTFFPGTMDAKKAQVLMGYFPIFNYDNVAAQLTRFFTGGYWPILAVIALLALLLQLRIRNIRSQPFIVVSDWCLFSATWFIFAIGLFSAYCVFNVSLWTWYVVPIGFALALSFLPALAALTLSPKASAFGERGMLFFRGAAVALVAVFLLMGYSTSWGVVYNFFENRHVNPHLEAYDPIANYLRAAEPAGTSVAMAEPGTFAFKLGPQYQVLDVLGLASPGVAKALLAGDYNFAITTWHPKYVITSWLGKYDPSAQPGFASDYELIGEFEQPYWAANLKRGAYLYRRRTSPLPAGRLSAALLTSRASRFEATSQALATPVDQAAASCNIETINQQHVPSGRPLPIRHGENILLTGWAATNTHRPPGDIQVVLAGSTGNRFAARPILRNERMDMANYLHWSRGEVPAGVTLQIEKNDLPAGQYDISVVFSDHGKEFSCRNNKSLGIIASGSP